MRKVATIINPSAGSSNAPLRELDEVFRHDDSTITVIQTEDDTRRFCEAALERPVDLVVVYGGDGTVSRVLGGLAGSGIPVMILRGGTGNLIADELGLPNSLSELLDLAENGKVHTRDVDLGRIDPSHWFVLRCGCGLEVSALRETDSAGKSVWGKLAYAGGLAKAIPEQELIDFRIWLDGSPDPIEETGVALTVANAGRIGVGPLQISPSVDMSDGFLDVCLIEKAAWTTVVRLIASNLPGVTNAPPELEAHALIRVQKATRVRVETHPPTDYQVDGDIAGRTPFEIQIFPGAARLVVPSAVADAT